MPLNLNSGVMGSPTELYFCKVVRFNAVENTADVVTLDDNVSIYGAMITSSVPSSLRFGQKYVPIIEVGMRYFEDSSQDVYCVAAFMGDYNTSCILGFFTPTENQLSIPEYGLYIFKHESDVIFVVRSDGTTFMYHPSGTYIKIGVNEESIVENEDLLNVLDSGKFTLVNKESYNSINPTGIFIRHYAGQQVTLDSSGGITIKTTGGSSTITMTPDGVMSISTSSKVNVDSKEVNITADTVNATTETINALAKTVNVTSTSMINLVTPDPGGLTMNGLPGFTGGGRYTIANNGIVTHINPN